MLNPGEERVLQIIYSHHALEATHTVWQAGDRALPSAYESLIAGGLIERSVEKEMVFRTSEALRLWTFVLTPKGMLIAKSLFLHPKDV